MLVEKRDDLSPGGLPRSALILAGEKRLKAGELTALASEGVERQGRVLGEAFDEGGVGAFGKFEKVQAVGGASEQTGVRFKDLGAAKHAGRLGARRDGRQGGRRGVIHDEAAEGLAAEVDAGAVREADPRGVVLHAGGRLGEKVAPVAGVGLGEERATFAVGAGRNETVGLTETVAHGGEGAAVGVGAGLDPDNGGGATGEVEEGVARIGRELVEHVTDDEGERRGGQAEAGRIEQGQGRERFAGAGGGEGDGLGSMVVQVETGEMRRAKGGEHAAAGDAAAAAPVHQDSAGGRGPGAAGELAEKGVPLPGDALGVGGVVGGERVVVLPIRRGAGGGFAQKRGAEAVERVPVEVVEIRHGAIKHQGGRGLRAQRERMDGRRRVY